MMSTTEINQANLEGGKSLILAKLENGWGRVGDGRVPRRSVKEEDEQGRSVENVSRGGKENVDVQTFRSIL